MKDNKPQLNVAEKSNSGKKKDWLYFDRTFEFFRVFLRVALASELWYKSYTRADDSASRVYKVISLDVEADREDTTLTVYSLTLLGFMISIAKI